MRILAALVCSAVLFAGEADPKAQAKAVWTAAAKSGDVWTCLQVEAWGRKVKAGFRQGSILGESVIIGDPLMAVPEAVEFTHDGVDRVITSSHGWLRVWAPDGRPLQPAVNIGLAGWQKVVGFGGAVIAAVERHRSAATGEAIIDAGSFRIIDGFRLTGMQLALSALQSVNGRPSVADDGSAVACEIHTSDAVTGATTLAVHVVNAAKVQRVLPGVRLEGVGRQASWLCLRDTTGPFLLAGERRTDYLSSPSGSSFAEGPGLAACVVKKVLMLVGLDGSMKPIAGGPAIGGDPFIASVGGWLVVGSGNGAKMISQGDLLGENAGVEVDQPPTIALWRWSDLAKDPAAKPLAIELGRCSIASDKSAAIWVWVGSQVDCLDLSGNMPKREPQATSTKPIGWVSTNFVCMHIRNDDGSSVLYDQERREVWSGACTNIELTRRDLALVTRTEAAGMSYALVRLAPDPALRQEIRLGLPPQEQRLVVSYTAPDQVVASADSSWWRLVGFDGKVQQTGREAGPKAVSPPDIEPLGWYDPHGAFYSLRCRLVAKATGPDEDRAGQFDLRDAWRSGQTIVLLERQGQVLVSGRKRGEWIDLGNVPEADRIALASGQLALVQGHGEETRVLATIDSGPKLNMKPAAEKLAELPPGAWRIDRRNQFSPPRGKQAEWDTERLGWQPMRLRSPEGGNMLVVTRSVVIDLTPEAARLVSK